MNSQYIKNGIRDGIPISLGYFSVSIAYGMAAILQGMTPLQTVIISLTNLSSAGQFAGTSLLCQSAGYVELALTMLVINARYLLMALSLSQKLDEKMSFLDRLLISYGITDEIYAVEIAQRGRLKFVYMMSLILTSAAGWVAGTAVGALASSWLPASLAGNLAIALYAMFIAIVIPASRKSRPVLSCAAASVALSCLFFYVPGLNQLSSGYVIIVTALVVCSFMAWKFPVKGDGHDA